MTQSDPKPDSESFLPSSALSQSFLIGLFFSLSLSLLMLLLLMNRLLVTVDIYLGPLSWTPSSTPSTHFSITLSSSKESWVKSRSSIGIRFEPWSVQCECVVWVWISLREGLSYDAASFRCVLRVPLSVSLVEWFIRRNFLFIENSGFDSGFP